VQPATVCDLLLETSVDLMTGCQALGEPIVLSAYGLRILAARNSTSQQGFEGDTANQEIGR
jgi:hypothetical protein